jgi:hypothetical protein
MVASLDQAFGSMDSVASAGSGGGGRASGGGDSYNKREPVSKESRPALDSIKSDRAKQGGGGGGGGGDLDVPSGTSLSERIPIPYPITTEEKLQSLSHELQKQKEYMEQNRVGYIDKLLNKRRDILKMVMFCLVILLALSFHTVIKHYYKLYFESCVLTPTKEFFLRMVYPVVILFALWNSRLLVRA